MPFYCFITPSGNRVERWFSIADYCARKDEDGAIIENGLRLTRDFQGEIGAGTPGNIWRNFTSEVLGVMPHQVPEARKYARQKGIPIDYTEDGAATFSSRRDRKRAAEAFGYFDKQGGYGDPHPK